MRSAAESGVVVFLVRLMLGREEEKLGAIQPNAFGAAKKRIINFRGKFDICLQRNLVPVRGLRR